MRSLLLVGVAATAACSFSSPRAANDASVDAPPVVSEVRFVSVSSSETMLRPGRYGIEVTAVLHNGLSVPISGIRASLSFREGSANRARDFRWRDADARDGVLDPQPASIPPGGDATFRFRVDALAQAARTGPILLNGEATFQLDGAARSAMPLDPPTSLPFATLPPPIVVNHATDEDNADANLCLREAIKQANANPGLDRITFDPAVFPPTAPVTTLLSNNLAGLPPINGDLVIDAGSAGVEIAINSSWKNSDRYALRLQSGTLVLHGLELRDLAESYTEDSLSGNNCGSGAHAGGAINVEGGTLILDGNRFSDPGVGERNCFAASVYLRDGSGHRILNNTWTNLATDALYVDTATREISGNVVNASLNPGKSDDCFVIVSQGNTDLWVVGNVCIDQEFNAIFVAANDTATLYAINNMFARNQTAVVRNNGRRVELHNNVYLSNMAAITADQNGINLKISHESTFGNGSFCNLCSAATIQMPTNTSTDPALTNAAGATPADFTPRAGSLLLDSGLDMVDRNGATPGRFNGTGPERGTVELP